MVPRGYFIQITNIVLVCRDMTKYVHDEIWMLQEYLKFYKI